MTTNQPFNRFRLFIAAMLLAFFCVSSPAFAICLMPPGDVNGNDSTDIVDLQCGILIALWDLVDDGSPAPACAVLGIAAADVNCDLKVTVSDLQLIIQRVLDEPFDLSIDANANLCIDACEGDDVCFPNLYSEGFDGEETAFSFDNTSTVAKWQVNSGGMSVSTPGALYYGNPATGDYYDTVATSGTATSPTIYLPNQTDISVNFAAFLDVESGTTYDQLTVSVVSDGVATVIWDKTDYTQMGVWESFSISLDAYAGQAIRIQFSFNSVDTLFNTTAGVYIDAFAVLVDCPVPCDTDADCTDGNACTNDSCDPSVGCIFADITCEDGSACTTDLCDPNTGCVFPDVDCADGDSCTDDLCDDTNGCNYAPTDCNDSDACTNDSCNFFTGCASVAIICDDNDDCTSDSCDLDGGCVFTPLETAICCFDTDYSEGFDGEASGFTFEGSSTTVQWQVVDQGQSVSSPGALYYGNPDTGNFDDGLVNSGTATSPPIAVDLGGTDLTFWLWMDTETPVIYDTLEVHILTDTGLDVVWDKDAYNAAFGTDITWQKQVISLDAYVGQTLQVVFDFDSQDSIGNGGEGIYIDDVEIRTPCFSGCLSDEDCGDGDACTDEVCLDELGCSYTPTNCDDGSLCSNDTCNSALGCVYEIVLCDDQDFCTQNNCNNDFGCDFAQTICDDNNPCTADACDGVTGECSYIEVICNDGDDCTVDSCTPDGCEFNAIDSPECCTDNFYYEDFEGATSSFVFDNLDTVGSYWQVDKSTAFGGLGSLYYGNLSTGSYGNNSVGYAKSPIISLPPTTGATLSFWAWLDMESCCDDLEISIETLGTGTTTVVWEKSDYQDQGAMGTWQKHTVNLDTYGGMDIIVHFYFDSDSSVTYEGARFDDISIDTPCPILCLGDAECDDDDLCTADKCDPLLGCTHLLLTCNDDNACTADSCDPVDGCLQDFIDCGDFDDCTIDICDIVEGCQNPQIDCEDGNLCTTDTCNSFSGGCSSEAMYCDDNDTCTNDACVEGACVYEAIDSTLCCFDIGQTEGFEDPNASVTFDDSSTTVKWQIYDGGQTHEGSSALYYGNPETGNYSDVLATVGTASMTISVPNTTGGNLSFWVWMDTETSTTYDKLDVFINDGTGSVNVWTKGQYNTNNMATWQKHFVDLSPWAGAGAVTLSFTFDSIDSTLNSTEGVYIDEIAVGVPCTSLCAADSDCDDNDPCTTESCANGLCGYSPVLCNDNEVCTVDVCQPGVGCLFNELDCDDFNECTSDSCELGVGCQNKTGVCDDGDLCTADTCINGVGCGADPIDCNDNDPCTTDLCDPQTGCEFNAIDTPECCKEGIFAENFDSGTISFEFVNQDSDSKWQIVSTFNGPGPASAGAGPNALYYGNEDQQSYANNALGLATSNLIAVPGPGAELSFWANVDMEGCCDTLSMGILAGGNGTEIWNKSDYQAQGSMGTWQKFLINLDAYAGQTIQISITFDSDSSVTYDGVYFDGFLMTKPCDVIPVGCTNEADCQDGDSCTFNLCDTATGDCFLGPNPCDDGDACTLNECDPIDGCDTKPVLCDDNNPCTQDFCDNGQCISTLPAPGCCLGNADCQDNDPCSFNFCENNQCQIGPNPCDDGNACTLDECDPEGGCDNKPVLCDDNNPCTADACFDGQCVSTPLDGCCNTEADCQDGNPCTFNFCEGEQCVLGPDPCDDFDLCTMDSCNPNTGACETEFIECDDGNDCTDDFCDSSIGMCVAIPAPNDSACDDGDPCTGFDSCFFNACTPGQPVLGPGCGPDVKFGDVIVTEIMNNPSVVADSVGEWMEVHNPTSNDIDLLGWVLRDDGTDNHTIDESVIVPAGGYAVLGRNDDFTINGNVDLDYAYGASFTLGNGADEVFLEFGGVIIDGVIYDGGTNFPDLTGVAMNLDPSALDAVSNDAGANWCEANAPYGAGDLGTPGLANASCGPITPIDPVTHEVIIGNFAFQPQDLIVEAGDSVIWTNQDSFPHTASADDFSFDTGVIDPFTSAAPVTFTEGGVVPYHCNFHPVMTATIIVE